MNAVACARCGSVRDPLLLGVLPCEFCGAAPEEVEDAALPDDDSWSGSLGREAYEEEETAE